MLPDEIKAEYQAVLLNEDEEETHLMIVKVADKLSAYIKCLEELSAGNTEFSQAEKSIRQTIEASELLEVAYFMEHFITSFSLTLDDLSY